MSTLNELIEKKKQSTTYNQEAYSQQQQDEAELLAIINDEKFTLTQKEMGKFSKEDILKAAEFTVKSRSYGIAADVDATDSRIYYKQDGDSRFFLNRKSIRDKAAVVVQKAQGILAKKREAALALQRKEQQVDGLVGAFDFKDELTAIEEDYKEDTEYTKSLANSEAFKRVDTIIEDEHAMSKLKEALKSSEAEDSQWQEGKEKQSSSAVVKKELDGVDAALQEKLPSAKEMKDNVLIKLRAQMKRELMTEKDPEGAMEQKKQSYEKYAKMLFEEIDKMYADVSKGKLSPDVVKLFMRSDLMAHKTKAETGIYEGLIFRSEKVEETDLKYKQAYKAEVLSTMDLFPENCIKIQQMDAKQCAIVDAYNKLPAKLKAKEKITDKNKDLAFKIVVNNTNEFMHFRGVQARNFQENSTTTRFYITAKKGKHAEMLKIWNQVLSEEKKESNLVDRMYFKFHGDVIESRMDNIVIYQTQLIEDGEMKQLLDKFYKACADKDVLEDEKNMPNASVPIEGYKGGITTAPEFGTNKTYKILQKYGIFGDKTLDEQLRKETGEAVEIVGGLTSPKFSYNTYIAKAMFLSAEIICKKRGIAHDKIDERIKNDQSVRTEFKKLVSDFIKLGGVDLKSMKRTVA